MISDWETITAYWDKFEQKRGNGGQVWFVLSTFVCPGVVTTQVKFCNFYPHLSLETVFLALKLIQNIYINMNISFS